MAASNVLTSNQLIKSIIRRAMIPNDQNTFTDEDFLEMINEEMGYFAVPHLLQNHEEYLVNQIDFSTVDEDGNVLTEYEIPSRAVGNKLRDVSYIDTTGNVYELHRISLEDLSDYNNDFVNDYPQLFYVQNNKIKLVDGSPNVNETIRMHFYLKPNKLVTEDRITQITSIDRNSGLLTFQDTPDNLIGANRIDFIQKSSPNNILSFDIEIDPVSLDSITNSLTVSADSIPRELQVGDYVALAGETIVPQLPTELHPILAQRVAVQALEAMGDSQGYQIAEKRLMQMEEAVLTIIDNRVEGAPEKVNNRHGTLREATRASRGYARRRNGGY